MGSALHAMLDNRGQRFYKLGDLTYWTVATEQIEIVFRQGCRTSFTLYLSTIKFSDNIVKY